MAAWSAVSAPVEGTVLSVATRGGPGGRAEAGSDDLAAVARAAAEGAAKALVRTPEQLSVLARAGVVDAGGRGLVVLLDALVDVVDGAAAPPARPRRRPPAVRGRRAPARRSAGARGRLGASSATRCSTCSTPRTRRRYARCATSWLALGDSLVVVGDGGGHLERPRARQRRRRGDRGRGRAGRPHRISVVRFEDQSQGRRAGPPTRTIAGRGRGRRGRRAGRAVRGRGRHDRDRAQPVDRGAARRHPGDRRRPGRAAAGTTGPPRPSPRSPPSRRGPPASRSAVVPIRSPVQALAALAVRDPARRFDDDVIAMAEAAGACRYAEVCDGRPARR